MSELQPSTPEQIEEWWRRAEKDWKKPREQIIREFDEQIRELVKSRE